MELASDTNLSVLCSVLEFDQCGDLLEEGSRDLQSNNFVGRFTLHAKAPLHSPNAVIVQDNVEELLLLVKTVRKATANAVVLKKLEKLRNPNLVAVRIIAADTERITLAQEYLEGGDLYECMQQVGVLTESCARMLMRDLVSGLSCLHENGIAHRALKPEYCVFDRHGTLKIVHFSRSADCLAFERCDCADVFSAPEVVRGLSHDGAAADVWSLGAILFEMVVGELPFQDVEALKSFREFQSERLVTVCISADLICLIRGIFTESVAGRTSLERVKSSDWLASNNVDWTIRDGPCALMKRLNHARRSALSLEMGLHDSTQPSSC